MADLREIVESRLPVAPFGLKHRTIWADQILTAINAAGYVILPASEAQAIRDKALEEAAQIVEQHTISYGSQNHLRPRLDGDRNGIEYAVAIRSLKGEKP